MKDQDLVYRLGICLEADKCWIADAKRQGLNDSALFFSREAQSVRRQLQEA